MALLEKYSLVQWDRGQQKVYIHEEAQLIVRHLHPQPTLTSLVNRLVDYGGNKNTAEAPQNTAKWITLLPHGRKLSERLTATKYPEETYALTKYSATACHVACLFHEGLSWAQQALQIAEQRYEGQDHADIAAALDDVGMSLRELGSNQEALAYHKQALVMNKRLYPDQDHPYVAETLYSMGEALEGLGRCREAADYYQQALCMALRIFKQEHPHITKYAQNLINALRQLKDPVLIQQIKAEVIPLCKQWLGEDHTITQQLIN